MAKTTTAAEKATGKTTGAKKTTKKPEVKEAVKEVVTDPVAEPEEAAAEPEAAAPERVEYYPKCSMKCHTLAAGLQELGLEYNRAAREEIAKKNGINNYIASATQDNRLLTMLVNGILRK